jgi:hypothetical protein
VDLSRHRDDHDEPSLISKAFLTEELINDNCFGSSEYSDNNNNKTSIFSYRVQANGLSGEG